LLDKIGASLLTAFITPADRRIGDSLTDLYPTLEGVAALTFAHRDDDAESVPGANSKSRASGALAVSC
jgi:hypothetical protein